MKKKKGRSVVRTSEVGWYHCSHYGFFGGIFYCEKDYSCDRESWWGPFDTFTAAKKAALEYFMTDSETAANCIRDVKDFKKLDSGEYKAK